VLSRLVSDRAARLSCEVITGGVRVSNGAKTKSASPGILGDVPSDHANLYGSGGAQEDSRSDRLWNRGPPAAGAKVDSTGLIGPSCQSRQTSSVSPTGDVARACYDKSVAPEIRGSCRHYAHMRMKEGSGIG